MINKAIDARLYSLDAMRGLAAVAVVLFHVGWFVGAPVFTQGYLAVVFFFALSGFVLAGAYQDRLKQGLGVKAFMTSRFVRLYPLYLLGLGLGILKAIGDIATGDAVLPPAAFATSVVTGILMLPSPMSPGEMFPFNGVYWSLFAEIIINVVFAVFLFQARTLTLSLLAGLGFVTVTALSWSIGTTAPGGEWSGLMVGLARVSFSFAIGMLIWRLPRPRRCVTWFALIPIAILVVAMCPPFRITRPIFYDLAVIGVVMPAVLYAGTFLDLPARIRSAGSFLGDASYPVYVIHLPLLALAWFGAKEHLSPSAFLVAFPAFVVIVGWAAGRYYDSPARRGFANLITRSQSPKPSYSDR